MSESSFVCELPLATTPEQERELSIRLEAARRDPRDTHGWQAQALANGTKYCPIIRRVLNGKDRYYVQLVQDGPTPWKAKNAVGRATTGLDIGPSTVAVVGAADAFLERFCPTVEQLWAEMRRLQRPMDRSRRATNPGNYNPDGTGKMGGTTWVKSGRYRKLRMKLSDAERRRASGRKRAHGELANRVIALGYEIKTERLSYRSFQGSFGRSVKVRAPGMFLATVGRKAGRAGGRLDEFPVQTTRLSQRCHGCGSLERKPRSQRSHACDCGVGPVQRDLYSGFLARHVVGGRLDACQAARAWPGAEPLLGRAASSFEKSARGPGGVVPAHARKGVRADRPPKRNRLGAKAGDPVRACRIAPESPGDAP